MALYACSARRLRAQTHYCASLHKKGIGSPSTSFHVQGGGCGNPRLNKRWGDFSEQCLCTCIIVIYGLSNNHNPKIWDCPTITIPKSQCTYWDPGDANFLNGQKMGTCELCGMFIWAVTSAMGTGCVVFCYYCSCQRCRASDIDLKQI